MAGSNGTVLTDKGLRLLTKAQTGVPINFTRVAIGDGFLTPEQNLFEMLSLVNEVKSLEIQGLKVIGDGTSRVRVSISNQGVLEGFFIREIGLFAQDPDEGEILYCISNSGDLADYIPAGTGRDIIEEIIDIITIVGRAENITAIIDESIIHASADDLKDLAGEGRTNETVKGNADKIKELRTSFNQQIIESIGHGVMSGLKVIPQTPESMSVVVTSGIAYMSDGLRVELTSNSTVAIDISDTINPRIDIVYLNKNATIGYKAGIPETISTAPDIPGDSLLLSTVNVPASTTQIGDVNINDERRFKDTLEKLSEKLESFKAEVSTHLADIIQQVNNINPHDMQARKEISGIKLKLDEMQVVDFLNKTGIGYYDLFTDKTGIDEVSTTATVNTTDTKVEFTDQQVLKMKPQTFDTFRDIEMNLYVDKVNKANIKGDVINNTSVVTGTTDKPLTIGDKLFIDDMENEITSATENITTNTVEDATVVSGTYSTEGNGSRKLVRLDNGWLVSAIKDGGFVKFYVSKNNRFSWTLLTVPNGSTGNTSDVSMVNVKNTIYAIISATSSTPLRYMYFDATNVGSITNVYLIESQTTLGNCSLTINPEATELHACWSSKNASYPNSFNIRYAKGTINVDRSVTWGSITQVTSENLTGRDNRSPSITVVDDSPIIIYDRKVDNSYFVMSGKHTGSTWTTNNIYGITGYVQYSPSSIYVPFEINRLAKGRIWVAWYGKDTTDTIYFNIKVSYSDDGGSTWSALERITTGNTNPQMVPSITANKNNEVFIVWSGDEAISTYHQIYKIKHDGTTWGTIKKVTNFISGTDEVRNPSTLFDAMFTLDFNQPLFIYQDNVNTKIGFYGTWQEFEGYSLTLTNPVTLTDRQQVPIVDFSTELGLLPFKLSSIDSEKYNFNLYGLTETVADITIQGKDTKLNKMAYTIA